MKFLFTSLFSGLFFLFFVQFVQAQETPELNILKIESVKSFLIPHLTKYADRKVTFKLLNNTKNEITLYGADIEGNLSPIRYLLSFSSKENEWKYPTSDGKPVEWKNVSSTYKKEKILNPGEFTIFTQYYSSETDCGQSYKVSIQIKPEKSKKTRELLSESYKTESCN